MPVASALHPVVRRPQTSVFKRGSRITPRMALSFVNRVESLDSRVTFTRASTATYFNSSGVLASAAINTPRFDYDPVTLLPKGLLIEESRANLLLQSNQFDTTWTVARLATPTKTGVTAPDGAASWVITEDATAANTHAILQNYASWATTTTYTVSVYAKMGTQRWLNISLPPTVFTTGDVYFDLQNGVKGTEGGGATGTMTAVGNGWYRCTVTKTSTAAASGNVLFYSTDSGSSVTVATPSARTIYLFGASLEVGSFPTSYIPTTTAAVTRAADSASMTGTNFSSWYNQSAGTFVVEFDRFGFDGVAGSVAVVQADDNSTANRVALRLTPRTSTSGAQGTIVVASVVLANDSQTLTSLANVVRKSALAYQVGVGAITSDGQAPTALTSVASLPTVTQLGIGIPLGGGAVALNGHIRRIQYYPSRLPNATLQALTA